MSSRQDGNNRIITLWQEKFSSHGHGILTDEDKKIKFSIPFSIISQNNSKPWKILLEDKKAQFTLKNVKSNEWIKLNPEMTSVCRINYSDELLEQLQNAIANQSLSAIDRLNIQFDVLALVLNGELSPDRYFKTLNFYTEESNYAVWESITDSLNKFNRLLAYSDFQELYHLYTQKFLSKIYAKIGLNAAPGENIQVTLLRAKIIALSITCKDSQVIQTAKSIYESNTQILPDLRTSIYRAVISDCDEKKFDSFLQLYRDLDLRDEKEHLAKALNSTENISCLHKIIDFAMSVSNF